MNEQQLFWIGIGVIVALWLALARASRTAWMRERSARQFFDSVSLPPGPPAIHEAVTHYTLRRERSGLAGLAFAALVALSVLLVWPGAGGSELPWLVLIPCALTGMAFGQASTALRYTLFPGVPEVRRVARLRTVTIADYVPAVHRWAVTVVCALSALAVLVAVVLVLTGVASWVDLLHTNIPSAALVTTLIWGAASWGERRILGRPQPATTTLELAWDDAIRSNMFRSLALTKVVVGLIVASYAVPGVLLLLTGESLVLGMTMTDISRLALALGMLIAIASMNSPSGTLYSRLRLWGEEDFAGNAPGGVRGRTAAISEPASVGGVVGGAR
ncbi:hypothetical protein [Klugiella xanthotipulae]|uniref:Uncharacterized protein n=1 Tax=Klugiella xanthotipulae TaxID=244735 RepID=A0A543I6D1_9MICO|nr:hypothetical protein [Klugiella xanthotipulae]TQM66040.1 hypothetical protein FB466_0861 [Klugiella xanthotipulae]